MDEVKKCLSCGHDNELNEHSKYCIYCGSPLINTCDQYNCKYHNKILPDDAAYCPYCGEETIFLKYGIAKSYRNMADSISDDLPF